MSETPGQILHRLLIQHQLEPPLDFADESDIEDCAAAFLAEMEARERNRRRNACSICGKPKDTVVMACRSCLDSDAGGW